MLGRQKPLVSTKDGRSRGEVRYLYGSFRMNKCSSGRLVSMGEGRAECG